MQRILWGESLISLLISLRIAGRLILLRPKADSTRIVDLHINKPKVFLSHAWEDKLFIERIAADLHRCHIEYWLDKEQIRAGRSWQKVIFQDGLPTCDAFLVYLTEDALRSKMVEKELDVACLEQLQQGGVALLPYVSNSNLRRQLRPDLQILQCCEWNEENYDRMLPEVVAEIWHTHVERIVARSSMKIWVNSGPKQMNEISKLRKDLARARVKRRSR